MSSKRSSVQRKRTILPCSSGCIKSMSIADDRIEDNDIGPLWIAHFSKIGENARSKVIVLALVYIIEDKAKIGTTDSDWSNVISQELRRYGIPPSEFWEIQSTTRP